MSYFNSYAVEFVRRGDKWYCYLGGWLTDTQRTDSVYLSISKTLDPLGPWTFPKTVVSNGSRYEHANDPSVSKYKDTWYMVYTAANIHSAPTSSINYSISPDGLNWTPAVATTNTAITIIDPKNIAGADISEEARPAMVFAPDCIKLWFDGFLTNTPTPRVYLAEAPYPKPFKFPKVFTVKHKYETDGFPKFFEPDVQIRNDGTYDAVYNRGFNRVAYARSTDGVIFKDFPKPVTDCKDPHFGFKYSSNPGFIYDQTIDKILGIGFGMTDNDYAMGHKIGMAFMQYLVEVQDKDGKWHPAQTADSMNSQSIITEGAKRFSKFRLVHPATKKVLHEQKVKAKPGEVWKLIKSGNTDKSDESDRSDLSDNTKKKK